MSSSPPHDAADVASPRTPLPQDVFVRPFAEAQNEGFQPPPYLASPEELEKIRPPRCVKTLESRIAELTEKERETLNDFRTQVRAADWCSGPDEFSDWELIRYLGARNFNIKKALEMLKKTALWRRETSPHAVTCRLCGENRNAHMMQFVGWDLLHRPVLYSSFRWSKDRKDPQEGLIHSLEAFNHAVTLMPTGVETWICITDFVTYSHWHDGSPKQGSLVIGLLQDHLPNRLAMQILIDPPTTFWVLWKCLCPFIDAKTKDKVRFWYTEQAPNIRDEFPKVFPPHVAEYLLAAYLRNKQR